MDVTQVAAGPHGTRVAEVVGRCRARLREVDALLADADGVLYPNGHARPGGPVQQQAGSPSPVTSTEAIARALRDRVRAAGLLAATQADLATTMLADADWTGAGPAEVSLLRSAARDAAAELATIAAAVDSSHEFVVAQADLLARIDEARETPGRELELAMLRALLEREREHHVAGQMLDALTR